MSETTLRQVSPPIPPDPTPGRSARGARGAGITAVLRTPGGLLGAALLCLAVLLAVAGPMVVGNDPFTSVGTPLQPPSAARPMGTDDLGRDVVALVAHGMRTSLLVALGVVLMSAVISLTVGAVAGSRPGTVDDLLMRGTEMVQVVPRFFLAVVVVALFGPTLLNLIVLLGLTSWTWTARVVRADTLSLRERDFVEAARSLGGGDVHILWRHVLPNVLPTSLVMLSVCASSAILIEAGLGLVGLSDPDVVSLGSLASNAQRFLRSAWWLAVFPGAALLVIIVGINLLGDALGDAHSERLGAARLGPPPSRARVVAGPSM